MNWTPAILNACRILEVWCIALAFLLPLKKRERRWTQRAALCILLGSIAFLGLAPLIAQFPFMTCVRSAFFLFLPACCSGSVPIFRSMQLYTVRSGPPCWEIF